MGKKYLQLYAEKFCLSKPVHFFPATESVPEGCLGPLATMQTKKQSCDCMYVHLCVYVHASMCECVPPTANVKWRKGHGLKVSSNRLV